VAPESGVGAARASWVLASGSPQRRAILERLGLQFSVRVPEVVELDSGDPASVTLENAGRKARAVQIPGRGERIIGCDTVVALEGAIYGKPSDEAQARRTLLALSGSTHEVVSGLVVLYEGSGSASEPSAVAREGRAVVQERTAVARTEVTFAELDGARLDWYVGTGEWRGRAGGYAIQGAGAALVRSVGGDYENVVGLPLASLLELCPELLPGG
jgi:septum formation protein